MSEVHSLQNQLDLEFAEAMNYAIALVQVARMTKSELRQRLASKFSEGTSDEIIRFLNSISGKSNV